MRTICDFHNFCGSLSEPVRAEFQRLSTEQTYSAGKTVFRQGSAPDAVYQLVTGRVLLYNRTHQGKQMFVAEFRTGDCFGASAVIDGLPRLTNAVATETTTLHRIGKKDFLELYFQYPEISQRLNVMQSLQIRMIHEMREDASSLNLHQRLARMIHRMAYTHAIHEADQPPRLDVSHEDLGHLLGASRQSIGKVLKKLEAEDCIVLQYGNILVKNIEKLSKKYEHLLGQEQLVPVYPD